MIKGTDPCSENSFQTSVGAFDANAGLSLKKAGLWSGYDVDTPLPASTSQEDIIQVICEGDHMIAEVESLNSKPGDQPHSHFVLVTGEVFDFASGKCRFTINDPACNNAQVFLDKFKIVSLRRVSNK